MYERKQYGQGSNCGIHVSTQQTELWLNAVANKSPCEGRRAKGVTTWKGARLGCRGPFMNCIVDPVVWGDESLETCSAELWILDSKLQHFVCGYLLPAPEQPPGGHYCGGKKTSEKKFDCWAYLMDVTGP